MHKHLLRATGQTMPKGETWPPIKPETDPTFLEIKQKLLKAELHLMQTLSFDLNVEHSYKHVLQYAKQVGGGRDLAQVR